MAPKALPSRSAAHSGAALLAAVKPKPPELLTVTVNQPLCLQQQTSVEPLPEIPDLLTDLSLSLSRAPSFTSGMLDVGCGADLPLLHGLSTPLQVWGDIEPE